MAQKKEKIKSKQKKSELKNPKTITNKEGTQNKVGVDNDLLLRMTKAKEIAMKKYNSIEESKSKELSEARSKGKEMCVMYQELEECNKIKEEFKINPPLMTSIHVNGKLISQTYEKGVVGKVELLKKHGVSFTPAVHNISTIGIDFKVFGKVYVKRSGQKILLEENYTQNTVVLKEGDILGTENSSFIFDLKECEETEGRSTKLIIFPKSELKLSINESTTNRAPSFMDPSSVSSVIKNKSKSTVTNQNFSQIELLSGLFSVSIKREGSDATKLLKINPAYPKIQFKTISAAINNSINDILAKMKAENPKLAEIYLAKTNITAELKVSAARKCDEINCFIELCSDGKLVISRPRNVLVHEGTGKMTKKIPSNPLKPLKDTFTNSALYETDTNKNPDNRVDGIIIQSTALLGYTDALNQKKQAEEIAKSMGGSGPNKDTSIQNEAQDMLKFAIGSGDKELIAVAEAQIKSAQNYVKSGGSAAEAGLSMNAIMNYERQLQILKPKILTTLPQYSTPPESDRT